MNVISVCAIVKTTSAHIYICQTHRDPLASVEDTPNIGGSGIELKIIAFCSHLMEIINGSSTLSLCVAFADLSPF